MFVPIDLSPLQMLGSTSLDTSLPINLIARETDGLSGSDLQEICRNAAMAPVREYMREHGGDPAAMMKAQTNVRSATSFLLGMGAEADCTYCWFQMSFMMRPLTIADFVSEENASYFPNGSGTNVDDGEPLD